MLDGWSVSKIGAKEGRAFISEHHYSGGCHNGPMCYGVRDGAGSLLGVVAYATPCSEAVRASVFGSDHKSKVTELHRLVLLDECPRNSESWFVAQSLRLLHQDRPQIRGVISFADPAEGHVGTIYQALNALYCGSSGTAIFYRDATGRLRHPRQCGVSITRTMARERGWTPERRPAKHRYLLLVGSPSDRRWALSHLLLVPKPYPKIA